MGIDDLFDDDEIEEQESTDSPDVHDIPMEAAEEGDLTIGEVHIEDGQESAECPNCGAESPRAVDENTGEELWYFKCPATESECDVVTFMIGSSGGVSFGSHQDPDEIGTTDPEPGEDTSDGDGWDDFLDGYEDG